MEAIILIRSRHSQGRGAGNALKAGNAPCIERSPCDSAGIFTEEQLPVLLEGHESCGGKPIDGTGKEV